MFLNPASGIRVSVPLLVLVALFTANDGDFLTAPSPKQTANNGKSVSG